MIIPEWSLRAFSPDVYDLIQPYKVTNDVLMPLAYQSIPGGRPLHNDWAVFQDTPRISTAYRVPLPFKCIYGDFVQKRMPWDPTYPQSPDLDIIDMEIFNGVAQVKMPHALVDCAVEGSGYAQFAVWLDGRWIPCFTQYRKTILGRLYAQYSGGLKQDVTVAFDTAGNVKSDIMGWVDPPSVSWNKIT